MGSPWAGYSAPFATAPGISGYDFGTPCPPGGWAGEGSCYGWPVHLGTDFGTPAGETIFSPGPGQVSFLSGVTGYGNELIDKLANGYTLIFGHVASGISGSVSEGQAIGVTGQNVGSSKGAVTLVQVLNPSGQSINPDPIISSLYGAGGSSSSSSSPGSLAAINFPGGSIDVNNPFAGVNFADPLGIQGAVTDVGHGLADAFGASIHDVGAFFQNQALAFFVAAVVLIVLFAL